jgi:hypothetical protein
MSVTAQKLDLFLVGFADWSESKPMTLAALQMSQHYPIATEKVEAQMNPDLDMQFYGML